MLEFNAAMLLVILNTKIAYTYFYYSPKKKLEISIFTFHLHLSHFIKKKNCSKIYIEFNLLFIDIMEL